jgi:hypothetical protein
MSDLVVDADIMRASGASEHPVSKNARLVLERIRKGGHRLVQTPALKKSMTSISPFSQGNGGSP